MNETKKYELVAEDTITFRGRKLFRIRALATFASIIGGVVEKGNFGGYIEKEENLSHNGNAWVCGDAKVCGDAEVYGDANIESDNDYITAKGQEVHL